MTFPFNKLASHYYQHVTLNVHSMSILLNIKDQSHGFCCRQNKFQHLHTIKEILNVEFTITLK